MECLFCMKEYMPINKRGYPSKYCSDECRRKEQLKNEYIRKGHIYKETHTCINCGNVFKHIKQGMKYCSSKCREEYYNKSGRYNLKCKYCGKEFRAINKKYEYCSTICSNRSTAQNKIKRHECICKYCGEKYMPKTIERNQYCSRQCDYLAKAKKCKICGKIITGINGNYCSDKCKNIYKEKHPIINICIQCGNEFKGRSNSKYCSDKCHKKYMHNIYVEHKLTNEYQDELRRTREKYQSQIEYIKTICIECGKEIITNKNDIKKYCSYKCSRKETKRTRRARKRDAYVDAVRFIDIYLRDKGKCQLCGKKINLKHKSSHPMSASLDHMIPLSLGGTHEPKNVQLAHMICNSLKGNGTIEQGEQIRLY